MSGLGRVGSRGERRVLAVLSLMHVLAWQIPNIDEHFAGGSTGALSSLVVALWAGGASCVVAFCRGVVASRTGRAASVVCTLATLDVALIMASNATLDVLAYGRVSFTSGTLVVALVGLSSIIIAGFAGVLIGSLILAATRADE